MSRGFPGGQLRWRAHLLELELGLLELGYLVVERGEQQLLAGDAAQLMSADLRGERSGHGDLPLGGAVLRRGSGSKLQVAGSGLGECLHELVEEGESGFLLLIPGLGQHGCLYPPVGLHPLRDPVLLEQQHYEDLRVQEGVLVLQELRHLR